MFGLLSPSRSGGDYVLGCLQNGVFYIPVEVVLPPDFPVAAPDVFVRPTETMILASNHPFVEASTGAVNTPSIVSWTFPRSNLTSSLTELSSEFGTRSPVYAKPEGSTQPIRAHPLPNSFPYSTEAQTPAQPDFMINPLRPGTNAYPPATAANQSRYPVYPPAVSPTGGTGFPPLNPYIPTEAASVPRPPAQDKEASLTKFRTAAIQSLTERLAKSIEQSEHLIAAETDKLLESSRLVEDNRKVLWDLQLFCDLLRACAWA
jgi:hypothetical protein